MTGVKTGHYTSLQSSLLAGSLPAVISVAGFFIRQPELGL